MYKISSYSLGIFVFGLVLLFGCTPYMKGSMQLDYENYEAAIESFQEELAQNPDNWKARQRLGFAYMKTGQLDQAISEFNAVLGQKPGDPFSTYYLGLAYLQNGERGKAIEVLKSYQNKQEPLVAETIKKQLTLLEISDSIYLARQTLAEEEKLKTMPPKSGSVAVFYFKDNSPDNSLRPLQKAMAAMIITDLSQVESLQVMERLRVQYLLQEMKLGQTGIVEEKTAPRAGRLLGVETLILGTMEPRSLHIKTTVASTSKKEVVGTVAAGAELDQFYVLEKEIVYNILKVLRVKFTPEEEKKFSQYHTKNVDAVLYFGQGLEAIDAGEWKKANSYFQKAAEEDPTFNLAILYRDGCPDATAPTIARLGVMTTEELAILLKNAVDDASAEQMEGAPTNEAEEDATGAIVINW
jgi:tetratricopeptide (TPR) repeat protein